MKSVIVSLSSDSIAMRECLMGVLGYANSARDWNVSINSDPLGATPNGLTPETVNDAIRNRVDGIITGMDVTTPGFMCLVNSGIPLVLNNTPAKWEPPSGAPISIVRNDDVAVGKLAASYLHGKGCFRSYAFVPSPRKCYWSTNRKRGFDLQLAKWGVRPSFYDKRRDSLDHWLKSLPKPAAVFASEDQVAVSVLNACRQQKLSVPGNVAVIGVDNDEIYCIEARPRLSSVYPDHVELGRCAAEELNRIMRNLPPRDGILIKPRKVIERRSTLNITPSGHLIETAIAFIEENYARGITASDVAAHIGVSESLLRLRFRTVNRKSVRDTILDARLKAVRYRLIRTNDAIRKIASDCGFSSVNRLCHFFTERNGLSPLAYRRQNSHPC